jgi:glycosyltransferase involved in cell wall biosynthesis
VNLVPELKPAGTVCGIQLVLNEVSERKGEGGIRTKGLYKQTGPDLPLVTVITVTHNSENTLEQCILSVLEQSYKNIEYIIIDGASSDGTLSITKKYEDAIDYYVSETDSGIYNAMNKGLSLAVGSYIIFLNSDDWYVRDAIKCLMSGAMESNADVTYADAYVVNSDGKVYKKLKSWLHEGLFTRGAPLRHETMLVKAEVYNKYGCYDESYQIISDYVFTASLYKVDCSFKHVEKTLLYFRDKGISSTEHEKRQAERKQFFVRLFPFLDEEDLSIFKQHGRLSVDARLKLIEKHKGKSELFTRSMYRNIADTKNQEMSRVWPYIEGYISRIKELIRG